jgi:hypothetical protein
MSNEVSDVHNFEEWEARNRVDKTRLGVTLNQSPESDTGDFDMALKLQKERKEQEQQLAYARQADTARWAKERQESYERSKKICPFCEMFGIGELPLIPQDVDWALQRYSSPALREKIPQISDYQEAGSLMRRHLFFRHREIVSPILMAYSRYKDLQNKHHNVEHYEWEATSHPDQYRRGFAKAQRDGMAKSLVERFAEDSEVMALLSEDVTREIHEHEQDKSRGQISYNTDYYQYRKLSEFLYDEKEKVEKQEEANYKQ